MDLDDFVFQNRNKEYGAYPLRKGYRKRFWISLIMALGIIICFMFFLNWKNKDFLPPPPEIKTSTVHLKEYRLPKKTIVKSNHPLLTRKEEKISQSFKVNRLKVDNHIIDISKTRLVSTALDSLGISTLTINGPNLHIKPVVLETKQDKKDKTINTADDVIKDNASLKVQLLPHYIGGDTAWYRFVRSNISMHTILKNGALPAKYVAIVGFLVHPDSTISDIKIIKDPGYGTGYEALRIVRKSGKWIPGKRNNKSITFAQLQTVIFQVNN